ncbi:MAG: S-formylglutathione hydrolase [Janthinobacterium lividum]
MNSGAMSAAGVETVSEQACFGGVLGIYKHASAAIGLPMRFSVFHPAQAGTAPVPVLFFLAGLTCNEETFMIKAGAQRWAAEHGILLVAPDTSARGTGIAQATADWDFGEGAGFYLDATEEPYARNFRMETYIVSELRELILASLPVNPNQVGIFGHSMGGHGALVLALRHPGLFQSVSAFAPIAAAAGCPWGEKAFGLYLGSERVNWKGHDASELMLAQQSAPFPRGILIDQGLADQFLAAGQLLPEKFELACQQVGQPLTLRRQQGYEHGYYFISTFMGDHIAFHHHALTAL